MTGATGSTWFRVPMSGAVATNNPELKNFHGDLFTESSRFSGGNLVVVECKSYKDPVRIWDIVLPGSNLNSWIKQTKSESGNNFWLLFFKWNGSPMFMLYPSCDPEILFGVSRIDGKPLIFQDRTKFIEVLRTADYTIDMVKQ